MSERRIVIATFDAAQILDVTGPLEVFSTASRSSTVGAVPDRRGHHSRRPGDGQLRPGVRLVADRRGQRPRRHADGGRRRRHGGRDRRRGAAPSRTPARRGRTPRHLRLLRRFVLAAAGLLDGRRATTHWADVRPPRRPLRRCHRRRRRHLRPRRQRVDLGRVTAGIDLALALVADDHGHAPPPPWPASSSSTSSAPADKPSSPPCLPRRPPTPHRYATCCPGCATTSPTTCPWPPSLARSTCPNASSAGSSSPKSASPPRTTSRPSDSNPRAGCWRPRTGRSSRSPGPAASAPPKP